MPIGKMFQVKIKIIYHFDPKKDERAYFMFTFNTRVCFIYIRYAYSFLGIILYLSLKLQPGDM